jgi:pimeloyl-ACP methyl ester carboxylesterase
MPKARHPVASRLRVVTRNGLRVPGTRGTAGGSPAAPPATIPPKARSRRSNGPIALHKDEITLHGRRVAYRIGGWGPLLVLVHGITSNSATWDRVLPRLAKRYTVLAPDLLGHGRSDKLRDDYSVGAHANTIRDLLDALGYKRATIVGHSLGGGVAMQVAYQYPERVDKLVLVAPGGFGREVSPLLRAASVPGSGRVMAVAAWRPFVQAGTLLTHFLGQLGMRVNTDLEEVGRAYALLADPAARSAFVHTLRSVVDHRGQRVTAINRLDATERFPALIIWGEHDRIVPVRHGERVHQLIPHTYLAVFRRAGHFPHRDDPARFVRVLDEFLAREWGLQDQPRPNRRRSAIGA